MYYYVYAFYMLNFFLYKNRHLIFCLLLLHVEFFPDYRKIAFENLVNVRKRTHIIENYTQSCLSKT